MTDYKSIKKVKEKREKYLLGFPNVVEVGIGYKYTKGEKTDRLAIVVGVRQKVESFLLKKKDIIPTSVDDVITDVVETNEIRVIRPSLLERTARVRPPKPGFSVGNVSITAGTFGCVVHKGGEAFLLSNAHVLCQDPTSSNQKTIQVVQPGPYDGGRSPEDLIGNLEFHVPIFPIYSPSECGISSRISKGLTLGARALKRQSRFFVLAETPLVNYVDAAIARPITELDSEIEGIGIPQGAGEINEGTLEMSVCKSGRTTKLTKGIIKQIDVTTMVNYGFEGFLPKMCLFMDQVAIEAPKSEPFSQGGDSGSVILLDFQDVTILCGLLFAGNQEGTLTIMNKITNVFDFLNVTL